MTNVQGTEQQRALVANPTWARPILDSINWNFSTPFSVGRSGLRLFDCRKYHWYPGTFIPEIPHTLIEVLSQPGARVYDPFAGIGTTIFQTLLLGRTPCATELNSVSVRLIRRLWILLNPSLTLPSFQEISQTIISGYDKQYNYRSLIDPTKVLIDKLEPWFATNTCNQIMYLQRLSTTHSDQAVQNIVGLALSAILKSVSAQDRGWGCIADNMLPKPEQRDKERNAIERIVRHIQVMLSDITSTRLLLTPVMRTMLNEISSDEIVSQCDIRKGIPFRDESIDLIVTSPPYPAMTDYSTSQRLSYYLYGKDPGDHTYIEIGARRKRFSDKSLDQYIHEMREVAGALACKVKQEGYICFVMPDFNDETESNVRRKSAVQRCLAELHEHGGFVLEKELQRILPRRRRQHNQSWATLEREVILIYRKVECSTSI